MTGLPISNQWYIQKHVSSKARAPGVLPKVVATIVGMACIAVASASSIGGPVAKVPFFSNGSNITFECSNLLY